MTNKKDKMQQTDETCEVCGQNEALDNEAKEAEELLEEATDKPCDCDDSVDSAVVIEVQDLLNEFAKEKEDLVNKILRLQADFDNYRQRMQNQIEDIRSKANESLVLELLPVIDNFERAINAAPEDSSFVSGVKMIFQQLLKTLEDHGLKPINALGEQFDPNFHEAVRMNSDSDGELVVTSELLKGYLFKGKVIRASMVEVGAKHNEEDE